MTTLFKLSRVWLNGFQSFDKLTEIRLSKLNLFFGPNSAGKSAVQDALDLFDYLTKTNLNRIEDSDLVARNWRKTGDPENPFSNEMFISLEYQRVKSAYSAIDDDFSEILIQLMYAENEYMTYSKGAASEIFDGEYNFSISICLIRVPAAAEGHGIIKLKSIELGFNGEQVCKFTTSRLKLPLNSKLLSPYCYTTDWNKLCESNPQKFFIIDGDLTIKDDFYLSSPSDVKGSAGDVDWIRYQKNDNRCSVQIDALKEISASLSSIFGTILFYIYQLPKKVNASRLVPAPEDLRFSVKVDLDAKGGVSLSDLNRSFLFSGAKKANRQINGNSVRLDLVVSGGLSVYHAVIKDIAVHILDCIGGEYFSPDRVRALEKINNSFLNHLFIDSGYRVDCSTRMLLNSIDSMNVVNAKRPELRQFDLVIGLHLMDSKGRAHQVEDVGSGIGYILPVVVTCSFMEYDGIASIQQPELHLHPALQAAIADVFIETVSVDNQLLIETHSEHLILRTLKRIRQTHQGVDIADELKLNSRDVSIIYFDPSSSGGTEVKHIRLDRNGDFLDRWPHGFFAERDRELFDE